MFTVSAAPHPGWPYETSSVPSSVDELRGSFASFEPRVQELIDAATGITKWALYDHEALPLWGTGRVVLLGDACHPMMPYMGQGAAMAIEDAAVLHRCLEATADAEAAFDLYETTRKDRTTRVQVRSRRNDWLKDDPDRRDPDWVFGFDPLAVPLGEKAPTST